MVRAHATAPPLRSIAEKLVVPPSRLPTVIFGAADPKGGGCQSLYAITNDERLNHRAICISGVLEHESAAILSEFFQNQRDLGKK